MPLAWDVVAERALATLTEEERRSSAVYLDESEVPAGASVEIDGRPTVVTSRSAVAFVDLEPRANWGHPCRYLVVDLASGAVRSIEAQFPPFMRGASRTLRLIWRGPDVPSWSVAVR